jgi:hypothetical protein
MQAKCTSFISSKSWVVFSKPTFYIFGLGVNAWLLNATIRLALSSSVKRWHGCKKCGEVKKANLNHFTICLMSHGIVNFVDSLPGYDPSPDKLTMSAFYPFFSLNFVYLLASFPKILENFRQMRRIIGGRG